MRRCAGMANHSGFPRAVFGALALVLGFAVAVGPGARSDAGSEVVHTRVQSSGICDRFEAAPDATMIEGEHPEPVAVDIRDLAVAALVFPQVHFSPGASSGHANVFSVVDFSETSIGEGKVERRWLLDTDQKYPRILVVDTVELSERGEHLIGRRSMAADHLVVVVSQETELSLALTSGFLLRDRLPGGSGAYLVSFTAPDVGALDRATSRVRELIPDAEIIEPDAVAFVLDLPGRMPAIEAAVGAPGDLEMLSAAAAPESDALVGRLWGLNNTGQVTSSGWFSGPGVAGLDASVHAGWAIRSDATNVVVGVIDTGVRTSHQDLLANMWVNLGEIGVDSLGRDKRTNVVDDDGNGFVDDVFGIDAQTRVGQTIIGLNDDNGHGTHCAGIIGAVGGNGVGISGVAPQVRIMSLKFLGKTGSGFFSDAVVALDYARLMGAHVTSNSYGYSGGGRPMSMDAAVQRLNTAGVAFVAAAGNDNSNNDLVPFWPASMGRPNVLSVAAMAPDGNRAGFSNFGAASVHVAAPGVNILSTWASGDASYAWLSGTSMAAPFVAGQLALLRAHLPSAPMNDLIGRVKDTALPMAEWSGIVVSGGRIQVSDSLTRGAPVILSQPEAASGRLGGTVELSVVAEGYDGFQWRKNGEIIPGAVTAGSSSPI